MRHGSFPFLALFLSIGLAVFVSRGVAQTIAQAEATPLAAGHTSPPGLIVVESPFSVVETMDRLEEKMEQNGLIVVARIDHAANAASAGEILRPTQLLIFGNPAVGTPLMEANQTAGIDLPQKFLAWEDADGQTYLGYNDPAYLAARHGLEQQDETTQQIATALAKLATAATTP
jgi:uncharacterized protein (DUF302 family)